MNMFKTTKLHNNYYSVQKENIMQLYCMFILLLIKVYINIHFVYLYIHRWPQGSKNKDKKKNKNDGRQMISPFINNLIEYVNESPIYIFNVR